MTNIVPNFSNLPPEEKTKQIILACASVPEVGAAVYHLYQARRNLMS